MKTVTVTVEVTEADIALARTATKQEGQMYCRSCVVAVAAGRYFEKGCEVGFSSVYVDGGLEYSLDETGKELRKAFDAERWEDVQPCMITLSVRQRPNTGAVGLTIPTLWTCAVALAVPRHFGITVGARRRSRQPAVGVV